MKKKKNTKHLDFHYKCMETGKLPHKDGLCLEAESGEISEELFNLIDPFELESEYKKVTPDMFEGTGWLYWASGNENSITYGKFTPLRQTIVLLMAAMNDEL